MRAQNQIMFVFLSIVIVLIIAGKNFLSQPRFGKKPSGHRLQRILKSPHYSNGSFKNISPTPDLTEGVSYFKVLKEFFFEKKERKVPIQPIPSIKTDLLQLGKDENIVVWFGHSSYFMQIDKKTFLVVPVFSGAASPIASFAKAFKGTDVFGVNDFPEIDYLIITHDHWDHLDYKTVKEFTPKVRQVVTGLGTGEHLESWGYQASVVTEMDWNQEHVAEQGFKFNSVAARHFSGRGLKRNQALWMSFVLTTPSFKIYIGGDSGYDKHFAATGNTFGPFDLAILENGQYDKNWRYIHMLPEQLPIAVSELKTKKLLAVHSSKFSLANHPWDEPLKKIAANIDPETQLITPMIGEKVELANPSQKFSRWWESVE